MDTPCSVNGERHAATLSCEISTMGEKKLRANPQKTSRQLMTSEQATRPKTLQAL